MAEQHPPLRLSLFLGYVPRGDCLLEEAKELKETPISLPAGATLEDARLLLSGALSHYPAWASVQARAWAGRELDTQQVLAVRLCCQHPDGNGETLHNHRTCLLDFPAGFTEAQRAELVADVERLLGDGADSARQKLEARRAASGK